MNDDKKLSPQEQEAFAGLAAIFHESGATTTTAIDPSKESAADAPAVDSAVTASVPESTEEDRKAALRAQRAKETKDAEIRVAERHRRMQADISRREAVLAADREHKLRQKGLAAQKARQQRHKTKVKNLFFAVVLILLGSRLVLGVGGFIYHDQLAPAEVRPCASFDLLKPLVWTEGVC